jgi:hypothetical protein
MALEAAFRDLFNNLRRLRDTMVALRLTVAEDKPTKGEAALVDQLEDTILDSLGLLDECLSGARAAHGAVGNRIDLNHARRALSTCQDRFHQIELQFMTNLASYERIKDLARLGNERRGEWLAWAGSAKQGVEQCREPLEAAGKALVCCWEELAERVGTSSVSVQNTSIGQKIITQSGTSLQAAVPEAIT